MATDQSAPESCPIFIVSGGAGAFGKHAARIALSQFPGVDSEVIVVPQVRQADQLSEIVAQVAARGGVILHTMVDPTMRATLVQLAQQHHVLALDTIGDVLFQLGAVFGRTPLGQPGLYRGEQEAYEARIQAIEYTVDHDDGRLARCKGLVEKPAPEKSPSTLSIIGRYILQPTIFAELNKKMVGSGGEIQITDALTNAMAYEPFHGVRFEGRRFDCGKKEGWLEATVAYALMRRDLEPVMTDILQSYANRLSSAA